MAMRTLRFEKNTGGLNTRASEMMIESYESPDLLNVKLTKYGAIEKEKGYVLYNQNPVTNNPPVGGIYNYRKSSTGGEYLIVAAGIKLYTAQDGIFTDISKPGNYQANKIWDFVTFNDICIAVNGADLPQKYTGGSTAENLGGSPPSDAAFIEVHKNRVFMAGGQTNPTKLSYSALSDPEDWTTELDAGWIEVGLNDGQKIIAIKSYYDVLIIFKEHSIYLLAGDSGDPSSDQYFYVKPLNSSIGAVSNRSIVQVGNEIYFLAKEGIYTLSTIESYGDLSLTSISFKIQSIIDRLNKSCLSESFAVVDWEEDRIWFFVANGSSTENDLILIYDYSLKAWTKRSGFTAKCGYINKNSITGSIIFYTGSYNGFIYVQKQGYSYNGTAINAYYKTPWLTLGNQRIRKRVRDIQFVIVPTGGYNMGVTYSWNYGSNYTGNINLYLSENISLFADGPDDIIQTRWDNNVWDAPCAIKSTKTLNGGGHSLQLTFWNSNADEHFILLGWYINIIERGIR